jgi:hypothetical protein
MKDGISEDKRSGQAVKPSQQHNHLRGIPSERKNTYQNIPRQHLRSQNNFLAKRGDAAAPKQGNNFISKLVSPIPSQRTYWKKVWAKLGIIHEQAASLTTHPPTLHK